MKDSADVSLLSNETTGIYESVKVTHGVFFRLEEHLDRFLESAKTVGLRVPLSRAGLRRRLEKELADSGKTEAFVRIMIVIRGQGFTFDINHAPMLRNIKCKALTPFPSKGGETPPLLSIIVTERTHPPEMYQKGVRLKTGVVRRNSSRTAFPEAKSTACLNQVLAALDPSPAETYEILFLNEEGYLTEVRIGNIFIVQKKVGAHRDAPLLLTPPPRGLLNGVTRRFVIECARFGKIPVEERPLMRHELFNAEEAFLTNTSWEMLPIREVDGRRIGERLPGPVTQKLHLLFQRGVRRETGKVRHGKS